MLDLPQPPISRWRLGLTEAALRAIDAFDACDRAGSVARAFGPYRNDATNTQGDFQQIPGSLDRSDRFFTNVERIVKQNQLPALSGDSRKFFTTTSAQIEQIRSEMDGLIGNEGTLLKFSEEARAAIKAADLPATTQSAREAADLDLRPTIFGVLCRPFGIHSNSCESCPRSRSSPNRWSMVDDHQGQSTMIRLPRSWICLLGTIACPGRSHLSAATPRHHAYPHD